MWLLPMTNLSPINNTSPTGFVSRDAFRLNKQPKGNPAQTRWIATNPKPSPTLPDFLQTGPLFHPVQWLRQGPPPPGGQTRMGNEAGNYVKKLSRLSYTSKHEH
jgi:hypothetical protein